MAIILRMNMVSPITNSDLSALPVIKYWDIINTTKGKSVWSCYSQHRKKNNGVEAGDDQRTRSQNYRTKQHFKKHIYFRHIFFKLKSVFSS